LALTEREHFVLISHRKQFIYTKTAKTAGTSVESYFEKYCMPEGVWEFSHGREEFLSEEGIIGYRGNNSIAKNWYNHMPAIEIRDKIGHSIWHKYFKFCVVRNPFDKLVSGFFFNKEMKKGEDLIENFRNWIKGGGAVFDRDKYLINGEICIDYFIRYENLEDGIAYVCNLRNMPFEPEGIPKLKAGFRNREISLKEFYDEETIQIVKQRYKFEIEYFNYDAPE
jgi:hypothetical protein